MEQSNRLVELAGSTRSSMGYCRAILKESTKNYIDTRLTTRSKLLEFE